MSHALVPEIDSRIAANGLVGAAVDGLQCGDPNGVASSTRPNAEEASTGANSEVLSAGSEVYANETVRTGNLGRADLVLLDNTNFSVGPASEVRLDKFVYDPTGSSGKVVLQATRGAFRFVTGSQDHRAYQVGTPWGTLGVRGTVVEGKVLPAVSKGMLPSGRVRGKA